MCGSIIINVLVYIHNGGWPVTSSIGLKPNSGDSPKNLFEVYIPSNGSPKHFSSGLHTFCWFGSWQFLGL